MFEKGEVTTRMIADEFDIIIRNARRWIDVMGEFLPIFERWDFPTRGRGGAFIVYGLLK